MISACQRGTSTIAGLTHAAGLATPAKPAAETATPKAAESTAANAITDVEGVRVGHTTIVEGAGASSAIEGRVKQLRAQVEDTTSDYDREKLQERLAKLSGGVAVLKVGAARPRPVLTNALGPAELLDYDRQRLRGLATPRPDSR